MLDRPVRLAVIGHPLAAEENRLAFHGWTRHAVELIVPETWRARGLGHTYRNPHATSGSRGRAAVHPLPVLAGGRNTWFLWLGLKRLLRRLKPDLIYCWEEPWCLATRQVLNAAAALGVPVIFYTAENRPKRLPWPFSRLLQSAFAACPACVAPTREIADRVRAWGYAGTAHVVPLWIRPRRMLRAQASARLIAYVGRLIPLKRVGLLIESLSLLPGFRLRIIGDGPERANLEAAAARLGIAARVEFRGHVANADLEDALEGAAALVLPTAENPRQAEQFGKAALEGVTCGLPVLVSRTGNLAALAEAFPTLSARDLDTPAQMARALEDLFHAYPGFEALAQARAKAEDGYGPAAAARGLETAFSSVLAPAEAKPA